VIYAVRYFRNILYSGRYLLQRRVFMFFPTRLFLGATAAFALCGLPGVQAQQLSAQDRTFMEYAATGGLFEVQMGQLGIARGQSQAVKGFCQRLINDHTMANKELAALAKQKDVILPGDDAKMMAMPVPSTSGADFDKEFGRAMIEDHQKDILVFEKEANSGNDPDVKNWASKTLRTLRAHLAEAQSLALPEQKLP
jgi:putative membrane protein